MNVRQLRDRLSAFPDEAPVFFRRDSSAVLSEVEKFERTQTRDLGVWKRGRCYATDMYLATQGVVMVGAELEYEATHKKGSEHDSLPTKAN